MAPPSRLPSARALALACAQKHESRGLTLPAQVREDLEGLARTFHEHGQLQSYFLTHLVDWGPFLGEPNAGHEAIADFLSCAACDVAVTANVDFLVEKAASRLGEPAFDSALDGNDAAIQLEHRPYLKLHGCCQKGRRDTLWCHEQLAEQPWLRRIAASTRWLAGRLAQRDIVFIGYWTDWAYLNEVLTTCLGNDLPASVVIVDPSSAAVLEQKAPALWEWARRPGINLRHEQVSGHEFLEELRRRFSGMLLQEIAEMGRAAFIGAGGSPAVHPPSPLQCSTSDLYALRRDWSGVPPTMVSRARKAAVEHELLGQLVLRLSAAGAILDGPFFRLGARHVRLIQAAGRLLHSIRADFAEATVPAGEPDITVCVGATDDGGVLSDIIRGQQTSSIMRPGAQGDWFTYGDGVAELGLN